jgi:hypothetical protein
LAADLPAQLNENKSPRLFAIPIKKFDMIRTIARLYHLVLLAIFAVSGLIAQSPTHIDTRSKDPKPFSLDDVLLYIVFPILLFIYVWWARAFTKRKREKADKEGAGNDIVES